VSYDDWKFQNDRDEEEDLYGPKAKPEGWCNTCEGRGYLLGSVGRPNPCHCPKGLELAADLKKSRGGKG